MIHRKLLVFLCVCLVAAYCLATLPLVLLFVQSENYRFVTIEEISRKLAHLRLLKYVFIGDSLTAEGLNWGLRLGESRFSAVNLGAPGYTITQIEAQLDNAVRLQPRYLSILAGTNDYEFGRTDEQIVDDYRQLLEHARSLGFSSIIVTSLPFRADPVHDSRLGALNRKLKALVEESGGKFLDLNSAIIRSPNRGALFQSDGLHFSPRMYEVWARLLKEQAKGAQLAREEVAR